MSVRSYVLDNRVFSLYQGDTNCYLCGIEVELGEMVVTKRSGSGGRRMYHEDCAVQLNIIESQQKRV